MSIIARGGDPSAILFGKTRRALLSFFYGGGDKEFYTNDLLRMVNAGHGSVQRELKRLADAGILLRTPRGRQVYYRANKDSAFYNELKNIIGRLEGVSPNSDAPSKGSVPMNRRFSVDKRTLAKFCREHHINKLSLFGSVLRKDFRPDSDIDVLVEFEPDHVPGFGIVAVENELSSLVRHKVDLRTPNDLNRRFRDRVVREAEVCYARA